MVSSESTEDDSRRQHGDGILNFVCIRIHVGAIVFHDISLSLSIYLSIYLSVYLFLSLIKQNYSQVQNIGRNIISFGIH